MPILSFWEMLPPHCPMPPLTVPGSHFLVSFQKQPACIFSCPRKPCLLVQAVLEDICTPESMDRGSRKHDPSGSLVTTSSPHQREYALPHFLAMTRSWSQVLDLRGSGWSFTGKRTLASECTESLPKALGSSS